MGGHETNDHTLGDFDDFSDEQLAREMARVQQLVTGLADASVETGDSKPVSPSDHLNVKLASAKKVMQLLASMRPAPAAAGVGNETLRFDDTRPVGQADSSSSSNKDERLPQSLGRFQIVRLLGQGGFGMVFLAEDPQLSRQVALKVPTFNALLSDESRNRFQREGRALAALDHPNIVPVYDVDHESSITFIASAFIDGTDLAKWIGQHGPLSPRTAAETLVVIAEALQHAHDRDVVHRDLKPSNILLQVSGASNLLDPLCVRVADFGLARLLFEADDPMTRTGSLIGTPAFSAPEQLQPRSDQPPDKTADVYSLGAILYFVLTGQAPFQANNVSEMVSRVANQLPESPRSINPNIPNDLQAICLRCLEKSPHQRYSSAKELAYDLNRFLNGQVTVARPTSAIHRCVKWIRRNPLPTTLFTVVALSTVIVSLLLWRSEHLRKLSETREQMLVQKSAQLQQAVDRLFLNVAKTPELRLGDFESFRKDLLGDARDLVAQFVTEKPDDLDLFVLYADTQLSFLKLSFALGESVDAKAMAEELSKDIQDRLPQADAGSPVRTELILTLVASEIVLLDFDSKSEDAAIRQQKIMQLVNGELAEVSSQEVAAVRASAISAVARRATYSKNYAAAIDLQMKALQIWNQIPDSEIVGAERLDQFAACYRNGLKVIGGSENRDAAKPIGERAIRVLGNQHPDNLSPDAQLALADIYRLFASGMQKKERQRAMEWSEKGHQLALDLVREHPAIPEYQVYIAESNYSRALLPYFSMDNAAAELILKENVVLTKDLLQRFPGKSGNLNNHLANSLTLLGLVYDRRQQLPEQLAVLQESRKLLEQNLATTRSDYFRVEINGLDSSMGLCQVKMGDTENGMRLMRQSIEQLELLIAKDPKNGQAQRYLRNTLNFEADLLCQASRFLEAKRSFDRLTALNGNVVLPQFMSDHLLLTVGLKEYDSANHLLKEYAPILLKYPKVSLPNCELIAQAMSALDKSADVLPEPATDLRKSLVTLACQLLDLHFEWSREPSQDWQHSKQEVLDNRDLAILLEEDEFVQLLESYQD